MKDVHKNVLWQQSKSKTEAQFLAQTQFASWGKSSSIFHTSLEWKKLLSSKTHYQILIQQLLSILHFIFVVTLQNKLALYHESYLTILKGDTTNIVLSFIISRQITLCDTWGQFSKKIVIAHGYCCQNKTILRKIKPLSTKQLCHHLLTRHLFQAQSGTEHSSTFLWFRLPKQHWWKSIYRKLKLDESCQMNSDCKLLQYFLEQIFGLILVFNIFFLT